MKLRWLFGSVLSALVIASLLFGWNEWKTRKNPYISEGLLIDWHYGGATPAYPSIEVHIKHGAAVIQPDLTFGGIAHPRLRFRDFDGDGRRDIVFEDERLIQAVAFYPATDDSPPFFRTLRNDIKWP
ncbi:MAG: hypothetical protein EOP84_12695 [Verrucomicrobiaceae bacterium]|nr:MAG: hypothetical protein EOP84_12695 [Verrucomicrobiaceae bacterium]